VPSILDGETPDDYTACLTSLGLTANVTALTHTDLDEPDGDVALTSPDAGTAVEPGSEVTVEPNPTKPDMTINNDCRLSGTPAASDPGSRPPGYTGPTPAFQDYEGSPYPGIDPRQTPAPALDVHLFWGTPSWGYEHITIRRGYGPADEAQTKAALAGPLFYQDRANSTTWVFDYPYSATPTEGARASTACGGSLFSTSNRLVNLKRSTSSLRFMEC
jgi:hypothetical protein